MLRDLVTSQEVQLKQGWLEAMGAEATSDGLGAFLEELEEALLQPASSATQAKTVTAPAREAGADAPTGPLPDLVALTKAYGLLHEKVLSLAAERRVEVSLEEQRTLATHVHAAIARAAEAAARRSAWELHHQAHQLRNPLGSALMALTVLRGRADLGENARLVEMAERNLKRIEGMIDESVSAGEGRAAAQ